MTRTQIQKHWKSGRQNKKASFEYGADVKKTNTTNTTDKKTFWGEPKNNQELNIRQETPKLKT